jgi:hypothetical protein
MIQFQKKQGHKSFVFIRVISGSPKIFVFVRAIGGRKMMMLHFFKQVLRS